VGQAELREREADVFEVVEVDAECAELEPEVVGGDGVRVAAVGAGPAGSWLFDRFAAPGAGGATVVAAVAAALALGGAAATQDHG
jgi:hypothetical protein